MDLQDVRTTEYILADRQWPRHLRIAHAKMQLAKAQTEKNEIEIKHWQRVLEANGT